MIAVISPAKTMDFASEIPLLEHTKPCFQADADYLAGKMRKLKTAELAALLNISGKLTQLSAERYAGWETAPQRNAVFAFNGDVYTGLDAHTLTLSELLHLQEHVRILSGLYGLLQPFDLIKPHRLEMGTALSTAKGKDLYHFWGNRITKQLAKQLSASGSNVLVNLASQEYFHAVDTRLLKSRIITPVFKDRVNGNYMVVSFFAKKARGMMCRFIARHRITDHEMLVGFDEGGYNFNHGLSKADTWVFTRG